MPTLTDQDVMSAVDEYLQKHPFKGVEKVISDGVHFEAGIWFLPVSGEGSEAADQFLAAAADAVSAELGVPVLLTPTPDTLRLEPQRKALRPFYIDLHDWQALCHSAGLNPSRSTYDASDAKLLAEAIRTDPALIDFETPAMADEVIYFFEQSNGIRLT